MSSSKLSPLSLLDFDKEIQLKFVEQGLATYEELEDAQEQYEELQNNLLFQYPDGIKDLVLRELRRRCEWYGAQMKAIERENRDARAKGVSFVERQTYAKKLDALKTLFKEARDKGVTMSKLPLISATMFITKPSDFELVEKWGFEKYLKYALI